MVLMLGVQMACLAAPTHSVLSALQPFVPVRGIGSIGVLQALGADVLRGHASSCRSASAAAPVRECGCGGNAKRGSGGNGK